MRTISMNAVAANDAQSSDQTEIILMIIRHPDLGEPIRLSTYASRRISDDPLIYGTYSTWQTTGGEPFYFTVMAAGLPTDQGDAPAQAKIVLMNLDAGMAELLRSINTRATVDMAVVLNGTPNLIEADFYGLLLVAAEGTASEITLTLSHEPITSDPSPAGRMTKQRFPGLHR